MLDWHWVSKHSSPAGGTNVSRLRIKASPAALAVGGAIVVAVASQVGAKALPWFKSFAHPGSEPDMEPASIPV